MNVELWNSPLSYVEFSDSLLSVRVPMNRKLFLLLLKVYL